MSGAPSLPAIDRAVSQVEELVAARDGALVVVEGEPAAGKSTVLARFAERQRADANRPVIELRVAHGVHGTTGQAGFGLSDDAGPILLATAASQLSPVAPEPWRLLEQKAPWADVSAALGRALRESRALVVIDDVVTGDSDVAFDSFFHQRARDALTVLLGDGNTRVVTTERSRALTASHVVAVEARSRAAEMLDPRRWNGLGESADRLAREAPSDALAEMSPLELRLAVALVSRGAAPGDVVRLASRRLASALFARLGQQGNVLREVVARLALVRGAFDPALLGVLGADALDAPTRDLLLHGLLYEDAGRLALHETFAREASAQGWIAAIDAARTHASLAAHHFASFQRAAAQHEADTALCHELEAFHHFGLAGDLEGIASVRAWLGEQLDALGKALSLAGRPHDAVRIYERAIDRDELDWYAHHYLAYNLDIEGRDPARVEDEYRRARELHPQQVWHHGRLVCFYVTRARTKDAFDAWERALRALERAHSDVPRLYTELHRPLARLLLHRGQLDRAREVLDDVPPALRPGLAWWHALDRLHALLDEAERDEAVFPRIAGPLERRWDTPQLVEADAHAQLSSWMPGRITHVDDSGITLRVAPRPGEFGWYDVPASALGQCWKGSTRARTAGTYVEVIRWKDGVEEILAHPPGRPDPDLPRLEPPPDRYLRALNADGSPSRN